MFTKNENLTSQVKYFNKKILLASQQEKYPNIINNELFVCFAIKAL